MTQVAAVVLAAGAATRFGSSKQGLLLPRVLERLRESSVDEIVVVGGAHDLRDDQSQGHVRHVHCPEWEQGPGASLRCGLAALGPGVEAAVVVLADGPLLSPVAVDRVVSSWEVDRADVVAASYGGVRGHPLVVARTVWASVPDEGLRTLEPRLVPCDDLDFPGDVDTPEDLERLTLE